MAECKQYQLGKGFLGKSHPQEKKEKRLKDNRKRLKCRSEPK